ncbi:RagB/SusD family nutrient uptake outer membrane protein [Sphingobacterium oryzagri]|uniref:RagB/SusD family nutrient uptake outer membrane protein n=1 Tax=Sphingobacterium oryzagri TaxID=3025669 RepID=A0ABY7WK10_9SPHI|nr:RagB/SusD family nutrient uptake outer membrane protein [Sphingobacterium sp. KACC 22765]WDF69919.1 RagB/SusD family nutrient uptake outer membrane protein [Sphingobacterium sp. KACC 22765]
MKREFKKLIYVLGIVGGLTTLNGCTNLEETVYDQLITDNYYNNKLEVLSAVLRPYTHANAWATPGQSGYWRLSEYSADQLAWPVKGRHGQDGGDWIRLHYHTWTPDEGTVNNAWNLMFWGMGLCTDPIENLEKRAPQEMGITEEERLAYIGELKLFRAFHYLKIMELWGNVPIVTKVGEPLSPPTASKAEVFAFIEKEILDNINNVPVLSKEMTGRVSRAAGYAMLVDLYLNAEVWTGTARWDDCIAAANQLINGAGGGQNGQMALDVNITDAFRPQNHLSKEVLMAIAYDFKISNTQPQWPADFFYFNQRDITGGGRNGNDGTVLIPGVFATFDNNDLRKSEWLLHGPQMRFDDPTRPVLGASDEYQGQPVVFVDNIRRNLEAKNNGTDPELLPSNMTTGEGTSGVRFNKYKLGHLAHEFYNSTDWNLYRLTWIYFAKAEAIMRKNGGVATPEAVELINASKSRAYTAADWPAKAYTTASLTLDELLAERGREFIFEGFRRQDLIRFGKFHTGTWWDHQPSDINKTLFPIPNNQRVLNANLAQNPGYN